MSRLRHWSERARYAHVQAQLIGGIQRLIDGYGNHTAVKV